MVSALDLLNKPGTEKKSATSLLSKPEASPYQFTPTPNAEPYMDAIGAATTKHKLPENLLAKLIQTESNFNPEAKSPVGATGIAQIMPEYHPDVDPTDPMASIDYSASYLRKLYDRFGDWDQAIAAYNAGPTRVAKSGMENLPDETVNYLDKIGRTGQVSGKKSALELLQKPIEEVAEAPVEEPETGMSAKEFYSAGPSLMGVNAPGIMQGANRFGRLGFGPKPAGGYDEAGIPLDENGEPYYKADKATGAIAETLQGISTLATHPMETIKGGLQFFAAMPGFLTGMVAAGRGIVERRTRDLIENFDPLKPVWQQTGDTTLNDLYKIASDEMAKSMEFFQPGVEALTGQPTPESELVGQVIMAPMMALSEVGNSIASSSYLEGYPNLQGAARFAGDIAGLMTMGMLMKGPSRRAEFAKTNEQVVKEAGEIVRQEVELEGVPDSLLKQAQMKVLEVRKNQLELIAKEEAKKVNNDLLIQEELGRQAEEIAKAKIRPIAQTGLKAPSKAKVEKLFKGQEKGTVTVEIPKLKSTEEAIDFGKTADATQLAEMAKRREELLVQTKEATKAQDWDKASELGFEAQLYREAIESNEGKINRAGDKVEVVEPITDLDIQTGTELPFELKGEDSPFFQDLETTNTFKKMYDGHKAVGEDVEVFTQKLINDVNRWHHGEDVPIEKVRDALSRLAVEAEEFRPDFLTGSDHLQWKDTVSEAADWAGKLDRPKIKRSGKPSPNQLNAMIPLDQVPDAIFDILVKGKKASDELIGFLMRDKVEARKLFRNKEIWKKTGYWLGRDWKWRYELDPADIKIDREMLQSGPEHGPIDLYADVKKAERLPGNLYKEMAIFFDDSLPAGEGFYRQSTKTIHVSSGTKLPDMPAIIHHELQHAINMEVGSPFEGSNFTQATRLAFNDFFSEVKKIVKTDELKRTIDNIQRTFKPSEAKNAFNEVVNSAKREGPESANAVLDQAEKYLPKDKVEDRYFLDEGEMEARLVEDRARLKPEVRASEPPWETLDKLLESEGYRASEGTKLYSGLDIVKFGKEAIKLIDDIRRKVRSRRVTDISDNQKEILENIIILHNRERPFEADFTYSKGVLWKGLPEPPKKFDLFPQVEGVKQMDVRDIKLPNSSIESAFIDPPFLITPPGTSKTKSIMGKRFTGFDSLTDLVDFYTKSFDSLYRVLEPNGVLVIKTQNITPIGGTHAKQLPVTALVSELAMKQGFRPVSTYRYVNKIALNNRTKGTQRVPRITSSEYQVWEKPPRKGYESPIDRYEKGIYSRYYSGLPIDQMSDAVIKGAKRTADYVRRARSVKSFKPRQAAQLAMEGFIRAAIDKSGNIRREFLKQLGDEGYSIVQRMYLAKGATARAAENLKQMGKEVYSGLNRNEKRILDTLILNDRIVDISKYKSPKQFKFPEGLKPEDAVAYNELFQYIENLTPDRAEALRQRAKAYFDWMKRPLQDLLDAGLITQNEYDALVAHNYRRLKLVEVYDKQYKTSVGARKRTVYDSGVEALSRGRETDVFEPSSEVMALEVFNRAYGRIMNNLANQNLFDLAMRDKTNPFARIKTANDKVPTGWSRSFVYDKGERKAIYLSPEVAKEWITSNPEMSYRLSQTLRYASGSPVLRTFATGINWSFALANLPKDVMHTWFAARQFKDGKWSGVYSPNAPVFPLQIGRDLGSVFTDAVLRKGRYEEYIKEGGGMEFLVHQGRLFQRGRHIDSDMSKVVDFLGYFGETSEVMTRLAIRDRVIRNRAKERGLTVEEARNNKDITREATFAARDYLDFGQGGGTAKALDNGIPYLNAAIQGSRGMFRAFKPGSGTALESTWKLTQFASVVAGLTIAAWKMAPLTKAALEGNIDEQNNLVIPLGDDFGFIDNEGQMRYPYIKLPLDPGQKFFKTFFEASTNKWLGRPIDTNRVVDSLKEQSPVGVSSLPPTISGALGYATNKDFWLNEDIWRKTDKPFSYPESREEYIPGDTPEFYVDLGAKTGLSPERTRYAVEELVTSGTIWSALLGEGYEKIFGELEKDQKEKHLAEVLSKAPGIRRFIGITNPYSQHAQDIGKAKEGDALERWIQNRGLDTLVDGYLYEGNVERKEIIDYIKGFKDKKVFDRLKDRFEFSQKIKDLPNRSFWLSMKGLSPEARAEIYVNRLNESTPEQREQLRKELVIVISAGGVVSTYFRREVGKLKSQ